MGQAHCQHAGIGIVEHLTRSRLRHQVRGKVIADSCHNVAPLPRDSLYQCNKPSTAKRCQDAVKIHLPQCRQILSNTTSPGKSGSKSVQKTTRCGTPVMLNKEREGCPQDFFYFFSLRLYVCLFNIPLQRGGHRISKSTVCCIVLPRCEYHAPEVVQKEDG